MPSRQGSSYVEQRKRKCGTLRYIFAYSIVALSSKRAESSRCGTSLRRRGLLDMFAHFLGTNMPGRVMHALSIAIGCTLSVRTQERSTVCFILIQIVLMKVSW